jgi:hypothetical protein
VEGICGYCNKPLGFIKTESFLISRVTVTFSSSDLFCGVYILYYVSSFTDDEIPDKALRGAKRILQILRKNFNKKLIDFIYI